MTVLPVAASPLLIGDTPNSLASGRRVRRQDALAVAGALDALPALPLDGEQAKREAVRATGTDDEMARTLAPLLAPTSDHSRTTLSFPGKTFTDEPESDPSGPVAVSGMPDKRKEPLTSAVSGLVGVGATGLEPVTPSVSS